MKINKNLIKNTCLAFIIFTSVVIAVSAVGTRISDDYVQLGDAGDNDKLTNTATVVVGQSGAVDYLCDGVDDNIQIQAAVDSGATSIYIRSDGNDVYDISSGISITSSNISIISNDFPVLRCSTDNDVIFQIGTRSSTSKTGENIYISGLVFDGGYPAITDGAGLDVSAVDNVHIENNVLQNFYNQRGLRVQVWSGDEYIKQGVYIENNYFNGTSSVLGGINQGSFAFNTFIGEQSDEDSVVDVSYAEHPSAVVRNFVIEGNTFKDILPSGSTSVFAGFENVQRVTLSENIYQNINGTCINIRDDLVVNLTDLSIDNNIADVVFTFVDSGPSDNISSVDITNNILSNSRNAMIVACNDSRIENNRIKNTDTPAAGSFDRGPILLYGVSNVTVRNNYVIDDIGTTPYGIWIENSDDVSVSRNQFIGPFTTDAIRFNGVNTINEMWNNYGYGGYYWGNLASTPTPFGEGDSYYNTTDHTEYRYDGTTWQALW